MEVELGAEVEQSDSQLIKAGLSRFDNNSYKFKAILVSTMGSMIAM